MSYNSDNKDWGDGTYRPAYAINGGAGGNPAWPAPPSTGASGADWSDWLDTNGGSMAPSGYRIWKADPANSGNSSPPPPRPKGN
jgi:hypothetical protein